VSQLAVGYRAGSNGRQQRSDGYEKHLGLLDVGSVRAMANLTTTPPLRVGLGLEMVFDPAGKTGYLFPFDREASQYLDLAITGKNVILGVSGGTLQLPAGSITTPMLAPNAASQLIGQYKAVSLPRPWRGWRRSRNVPPQCRPTP
jgi:hypothetical protein